MESSEQELLLRMVIANERTAFAQEELIRLATEERAEREEPPELPGLPICPHCGTLNPTIRNEGGRGPMGEFALLAYCETCTHTFIAEAQGWLIYKDRDEYEGREVDVNNST